MQISVTKYGPKRQKRNLRKQINGKINTRNNSDENE
jgi:hypothetical protein